MTVLALRVIGDPVLRSPTRPVTPAELQDPATQGFIDDLIETKRAAHGAGLAAPQVGDGRRIAIVEVEAGNPRYPYKPPYGLTVLVNPRIVAATGRMLVNEGCLSVPDLRGTLHRSTEVTVRFEDRDGTPSQRTVRGLTAGTFQHEIDHLDGVLFCDRADPATFATWAMFDLHGRRAFEAHARAIVDEHGA